MNTPLNAAPISGRDGLPQPTVATIGEEEDEAEGGNPASVLARVSPRLPLRVVWSSGFPRV